jgi:pimeloyl-ACP methyl ester carboxylesterase
MIAADMHSPQRDAVVLVHGFGANRLVMAVLARSLRQAYGCVVNWGYRSLWSPIEQHAGALALLLRQLDDQRKHERIHLVTHSMGGIVGRLALAEFVPRRFGRFVMIAPPNRGSRVATRLAPLLSRIFPPLGQLSHADDSFVCTLPLPAIPELGIITAKTDFLVHEGSTRLGCECDHIVLKGLHSSLLWRQETAEQVRHFLEHGCFMRAQHLTAG